MSSFLHSGQFEASNKLCDPTLKSLLRKKVLKKWQRGAPASGLVRSVVSRS